MKEIVHKFFAFGGARCEIVSLDGDERAVSTAVEDAYEFQSALSRFEPTSELSRFNAHAGVRAQVSPLLEALLRASLVAFEISDGLVNAASGNAVIAAGYDRTITAVKRSPGRSAASSPPPDLPEGAASLARLSSIAAGDHARSGRGWQGLAGRLDDRALRQRGRQSRRGLVRAWRRPRRLGLAGGAGRWRCIAVARRGSSHQWCRRAALGRWASHHRPSHWRTGLHGPKLRLRGRINCFPSQVFAKGALIVGSAGASSWLSQRGVQYQGMIAKVAA